MSDTNKADEKIEQLYKNQLAVAEALGVETKYTDTDSAKTKAFIASLGGGSDEDVQKAYEQQKQLEDADDTAELLLRSVELSEEIAAAAGDTVTEQSGSSKSVTAEGDGMNKLAEHLGGA